MTFLTTKQRLDKAERTIKYLCCSGGGVGTTIFKGVDETKANDVILAIDTNLQTELEANTYYGFICRVVHDSYGTPDIKLSFSAPTGADGGWHYDLDNFSAVELDFGSNLVSTGAPGQNRAVHLMGWIKTDEAGTFGLEWCQNADVTDTTTLLASSYLMIFKQT